jgi:serine/threonine-protein kinase
MFAGHRPFPGTETAELVYRVMNEEPPPIPEGGLGVPEAIQAAIARCLAREPEARFASAAELSAALAAARG